MGILDMLGGGFGVGYPVALPPWFRLCTKCIDPSAVSAAMAVSWA